MSIVKDIGDLDSFGTRKLLNVQLEDCTMLGKADK